MKYTVQRYCAKNYPDSGDPRRVYVIRDENGAVVATVDEGHNGRGVVYPTLAKLIDRPLKLGWSHDPDIADIGDVDVSPGVYRRMVDYRPETPTG